jgi:hypothetical protein
VLLERGPELVVLDLGDQLRQRLVGELALDVEDVAELVDEQFALGRDLRHRMLLFSLRGVAFGTRGDRDETWIRVRTFWRAPNRRSPPG